LSEGREFIDNGSGSRHILSYLSDFLFTPQRARTPVKALSGGETSRVMLAKLFSKPSNMLILDEPTNDLDVETLEMLENRLMEYPGTLLVVSHDRSFLDNVVTSLYAFDGDGNISEHVGGYSEWYARGNRLKDEQQPLEAKKQTKPEVPQEKQSDAVKPKHTKKLSYKLQLELDGLPAKIEEQESIVEALNAEVADSSFYQKETDYVTATLNKLEQEQSKLDQIIERWMELEAMQEGD